MDAARSEEGAAEVSCWETDEDVLYIRKAIAKCNTGADPAI